MVRSDQSPRRVSARDRVGLGSRQVWGCRDVGHCARPPVVLLFAARALSPPHSLGPISDVPHHAVSFNRTRRGRVPPDWRGCVGERDPRTAFPRTGGLFAARDLEPFASLAHSRPVLIWTAMIFFTAVKICTKVAQPAEGAQPHWNRSRTKPPGSPEPTRKTPYPKSIQTIGTWAGSGAVDTLPLSPARINVDLGPPCSRDSTRAQSRLALGAKARAGHDPEGCNEHNQTDIAVGPSA